jgi:opacity protein-like surface antigen
MNEVKHSARSVHKKTPVEKNEHVISKDENVASAIENNNAKETLPLIAGSSSNENSSPNVSTEKSETKESAATTSASSPADSSAKEATAVNETPKIVSATNDSAASKTQKDSTVKSISASHFSVSAFYSPNYSKEHLTPNTPAAKGYIEEYKNTEKRQYAYSAGITVAYDLSKHLSIATGGVYSTLAYTINESVIYAGYGSDNQLHFNYHTSCGTIQIPNPYNTTLKKGDSLVFGSHGTQVLRFMSIPLMVRYQIPGNVISLYVFSGVSANLMMQERATLVLNNSETTIINNVDGLKKMNYGFLVGAGLQYHVSNRMGIFAEPFYRASISSLTENLPFNCYPYSLGLNFGLSLHF